MVLLGAMVVMVVRLTMMMVDSGDDGVVDGGKDGDNGSGNDDED